MTHGIIYDSSLFEQAQDDFSLMLAIMHGLDLDDIDEAVREAAAESMEAHSDPWGICITDGESIIIGPNDRIAFSLEQAIDYIQEDSDGRCPITLVDDYWDAVEGHLRSSSLIQTPNGAMLVMMSRAHDSHGMSQYEITRAIWAPSTAQWALVQFAADQAAGYATAAQQQSARFAGKAIETLA